MPRQPKLPAYTYHKPSGQARVRVNGKDVYLGVHDSAESRERYAQIILDLARQRFSLPSPVGDWTQNPNFKVKELVLRYCLFAQEYYGANSKEYRTMHDVLKPVLKLFGSSPAKDFGPRDLKSIQQLLINEDVCRPEINRRISRIRRVFRWATSEELIPSTVIHGLACVQGLPRGRCGAREPEPVRPVPNEVVQATLPFCSPQIKAMIQLQRLAGMRPAEVTIMRPCDLDRSDEIWIYRPQKHKTSDLGFNKEICLGPLAQAILEPFLDRSLERYFFSPMAADAWRNDERAKCRKPDRKTRLFPCELRAREARKQQARKRISKRSRREHFDTASYRRAIVYAVAKAGKNGIELAKWHPHQLRHLRATEVRRLFGLEAAQVTLGHTRADVTQIYAERNSELAVRVAKEMG